MKRELLIVAIFGAGLAGCQSMNVQGDQAGDEPIYFTGSHLPSKSGANTAQSVKTLAPPPFDQQMKGAACVGGPCGAAN